MQALVDDYFKRDLSDVEEQRLEQALLSEPAVAESMARQARERYLAYGHPDPMKRAASRAWPLGWGLAAAAGLLVGLVLAPPRPAPPPVGAKLEWKATRLAVRGGGLGFAKALAKPDVPVRLILARRELVVVKVVAFDGKVLRILQAGALPAGPITLHWDRVDQEGVLVGDDRWRVTVEEGGAPIP